MFVTEDNRGTTPFRFLDPLHHEEAEILHVSTWDYVRIFEQAVHFCRTYLNLDLVPKSFYKRRTYLYYLGYPKPLAGWLVRPKLQHQTVHAEFLASCVTASSLSLPGIFPDVGQTRSVHPLDATSHVERERAYRNLKYQRGKFKGEGSFPWLEDS